MKLRKETLLYDISNIAYVIADKNEENHELHKVRDICQDGNIDRVSRILGQAYAEILVLLAPLLTPRVIDVNRDSSAMPRDYKIEFTTESDLRLKLTPEKKLKIRELSHEYMVCRVMADWLGIILPQEAEIWRMRCEKTFEKLRQIVTDIVSLVTLNFRRTLSPF